MKIKSTSNLTVSLYTTMYVLWGVFVGVGIAQAKGEINPYAVTAESVTLAEPAPLKVDATGITVMAPNLAKLSAKIRPVVRNYMILWCAAEAGESHVEWTLDAPTDGEYEVTASVLGTGSQLAVTCNDQKQKEVSVTEAGWQRIGLGKIALKAGHNKVVLHVDSANLKAGKRNKEFQLSALELVQPDTKKSIEAEALAMRNQPDWFKDAGYGLMFQWTNRATPPEGPIKAWEEKVNDFDLDGFISLVEESGASYVVWSITWGNQYISAPIKSLDAIIAGRTTSRDLLGEMVNRLQDKGIKVIFYYHYGYDCYHSQDTEWLKAVGGMKADKTQLFTNLMSILAEVGTRYGDKLDGWWFDGGARYLNCHYDGSSAADGILTAPFEAYTAAARTGNPERMVAYNSWIKPKVTEYQDYYGGEGVRSFKPEELTNGVFNSGRQKGLQAHGCFILEKRWGHIELNTPIPKPKYSLKQLTEYVQQAKENRYPLSINLEMYEDGSVSPASAELLKKLKAAVAETNPKTSTK
ncbi:alpha-L-fucosidase [Rubritalea spongiae]|uniref:Alpha-L-fucosidase n=1 Tax=Rubritalea spongiae TaxID=430797 RepID=A0ABW5DXP1_9BACT